MEVFPWGIWLFKVIAGTLAVSLVINAIFIIYFARRKGGEQ
jgi:hypothetical protein